MAEQTYSPNYGLANNYQNKEDSSDTPVKAADLNRIANVAEAQIPGALLVLGYGVSPTNGDALEVSAGSGLSVNIASGAAIVGQNDFAQAVGITDTYNFTDLPANRDNSNPLYLFIKAQASGGMPATLTTTRQAAFRRNDTATLAGAVLLARITTSSSAVTSVVDMRQFIATGGGGADIPDGTEEGQVPTWDGTAYTPQSPSPLISTKYHYSGNAASTLTGPAGNATLTPGEGQVAIKNRLVTATGAEFADITLTNFTSTASTFAGYVVSDAVPFGDANGNYAPDGMSGGFPAFRKNASYTLKSNGTNYQIFGDDDVYYTGPEGNAIAGTYTGSGFTATVTMSGSPGTLTFDAEFTDGKNYPLSVSAGTIERTQDGNQSGVAMGYESGVELRRQADGLALRVAALEDTPVQRGSLNTIIGINAPTTLDALDATYAVDTTSGNIVQPIPVVADRNGQQLRFTKDTNGSNTVTLEFDGGEDDIVLMAEGDTVTIQAYSAKWRIVGKYPPGDMTG